MEDERRTEPHPPLYAQLLRRLDEEGGVLPLNSEEALAYWVTVLQRHAAECQFGTNSDPVNQGPRLIVLGFSEVDLLRDDPRNILDETWAPIELRVE